MPPERPVLAAGGPFGVGAGDREHAAVAADAVAARAGAADGALVVFVVASAAAAAGRVEGRHAGNPEFAAVAAAAARNGVAGGNRTAGAARAAAAAADEAVLVRRGEPGAAGVALAARPGARDVWGVGVGGTAAAAARDAGTRRRLVVEVAVAARAAAVGDRVRRRAGIGRDERVAAVRAVGRRRRRGDAARADLHGVGRAARHRKRVVVDQAARAAARAAVVAAGAAARHDERLDARRVGGRNERPGVALVRVDRERVDDAVRDALHVAARAGLARAARREGARRDVRIVGRREVVHRLEKVRVGHLRREVRNDALERIARLEAGRQQRPRRGLRAADRPDLVVDVGGVSPLAKRGDRSAELRERRAGVVEAEFRDGLGDFRELRHRPGREEGGDVHRVVVRLHPVFRRDDRRHADFVHVAEEGAFVRADVAADGQRERALRRDGGLPGGNGTVHFRPVPVGRDSRLVAGRRVGVDDVDLAPDVFGELEDFAGDSEVRVRRLRSPDAHLLDVVRELERPCRRGLGGLAPDESVIADRVGGGVVQGTDRARPEGNGEVGAERVQGGERRVGVGHFDGFVRFGPLRRDLAGAADRSVRFRDGLVGGLGREVVGAGVQNVLDAVSGFAEVPDADVVLERVVPADGLAALRRAVEHRELGAVLHRRELHPDERFARGVPRVDVERERRAVLRDEAEVVAVRREHHVVVVEARDAGLGDTHEDGEVRERRAVRGVAVDREDDAAGEAVGLDRLQVGDCRPRGQRERAEREQGEEEFLHGWVVRWLGGYVVQWPLRGRSGGCAAEVGLKG